MRSEWLTVAEDQAGVISTAQLVASGVDRNAIRRLNRRGTIRTAGRALWIATSAEPAGEDRLTRLWIALLTGGSRALAWRRSAAALWDLDGCSWPDRPEIAVGFPDHPRRPGVPRLRSLTHGDRRVVSGVPSTGVARTLVDLAAVVDVGTVERALECVLRRRMLTVAALADFLAGRRSAGANRLARMLARRPDGTPPTESDAETLFAIVARSSGLPAPRRQYGMLLGGRRYRLDFAWPEIRLAVEVDGLAVHGPDALDADLRRQNAIVLDGWLVLRFTSSTVAHRPEQVHRDLRAAWATRSALAVGRSALPGPARSKSVTGDVPNPVQVTENGRNSGRNRVPVTDLGADR